MKQGGFFTSSIFCSMLNLLLFALSFRGTVHSNQDLSDPLADLLTYYETLNYSTLLLAEDHARIKKSFDPEETLHLNFKAHGRSFNLQLKRDRNLFADGLEFDTSSGFHPNNFYEGTLKGEENSRVHGFVHNNIFEGKIYFGDGTEFHIESSQKYPQLKDCHSYIYDAKHVIHPEYEFHDNVKVSKGPTSNNDDLIKVHHREKRATRFDSSKTECHLYMRADYTYSEWAGGALNAMLQMASHVKAVSQIYETVDFNNDNIKEKISFRIKKIYLIPKCSNGENTNICEFSKESIDVDKFLEIASIGNFGAYCLSYVFTHRDFKGSLGKSYVGEISSSSQGGICGKASFDNGYQGTTFNTGTLTNLYRGKVLSGKVTDLMFARGVGHNFGAEHDPDSITSCSPGGMEGNFIMYDGISPAIYPNNFLFSSCSKINMWNVIQAKGGCFVDAFMPTTRTSSAISTTPTPTTTTTTTSATKDSNTGVVATGISVPLTLLVIVLFVFCVYRCTRRTNGSKGGETPTVQNNTQFVGINNSVQPPSVNLYANSSAAPGGIGYPVQPPSGNPYLSSAHGGIGYPVQPPSGNPYSSAAPSDIGYPVQPPSGNPYLSSAHGGIGYPVQPPSGNPYLSAAPAVIGYPVQAPIRKPKKKKSSAMRFIGDMATDVISNSVGIDLDLGIEFE